MGKFRITQRKNGEYQFSLLAGNGQIILMSEGYSQRASCLAGIESVKINGKNEQMFDRKTSLNGKFYFNLKAGNGQIIGTSEMYESEAARENGIYSVMRNSQTNDII
ncbi:YegP family protein [uncultured Flavobacterium sp.]|uniref:YegP family protein n=1 Tax=uncultured Flavobacterium sp. TaxID=165435 RepID=UPI0025CC1360|nr:YegP family protein [uncultured Flavobacterium sp.]